MKITSLSDPKRMATLMARFQEVCLSSQYTEGDMNKGAVAAINAVYAPPMALNKCLPHTTLVSSAGAGLKAIAEAIVPPRSRVAVQNNTFFASGAMFSSHSLYLVDSSADCPSMSYDSLYSLMSMIRLDAVVLTHVGGVVAKDYKRIVELCRKAKVLLIEDCAHAFGVIDGDNTPACLGDVGVFSFYPTKAVPIGEGGAVVSKHKHIVEKVAKYANYGKWLGVQGHIMYSQGMNLRMSEWDAAVLWTQVECLPEILAARRRDAEKLSALFPCLLSGVSNFYKYPVALECKVPASMLAGKVYARSDQLDVALNHSAYEVFEWIDLSHSKKWADSHQCVAIGEGAYDSLSVEDLKNMLEK